MLPQNQFDRYLMMAHCQGWYATRQNMVKQGYSLESIASILVAVLWEGK